jgi:transcriptional repressor NrdR
VEQVEIAVVKHDGRREPFNPEKLRAGICLAIKKRPVSETEVERIVDEVEAGLRASKAREVPTAVLGGLVMEQLKRVDHVAYIRFASVHRDFTDAQSFQKEVRELTRREP